MLSYALTTIASGQLPAETAVETGVNTSPQAVVSSVGTEDGAIQCFPAKTCQVVNIGFNTTAEHFPAVIPIRSFVVAVGVGRGSFIIGWQ